MSYYAHQQQVIDEKDRSDRERFGNFRGTGSGKTRTTVAVAEGMTLVVCPKTQADEKIWETEWLFQNRPERLVVLSKEQFKIKVKKFEDDLYKVCDGWPTTIIFDEAHTVAGVQPDERQRSNKKFPKMSDIFEAALMYRNAAKPKRVYPLTATPAPNPMALFGLGVLLGRNWNYHQFRSTFYFPSPRKIRGRHRWLVNMSKANQALIQKTIETIGYTGSLQDWFDVPPQVFETHYVGTTKAQEAAYQELRVLYPDPLIQIGKRQRLEQGLFEETPEGEFEPVLKYVDENKCEAIEGYLHEFKKVVVFARYVDQIELYRRHFEGKTKVFTMTGATKNRAEILQEARDCEECLFIVQCQISAGWELADFPCMIFASLDYSFVNYDQAIGRILRGNNLKRNLYVFLIAGDGDERVHKAVMAKEHFVSEKSFIRRYKTELCTNKKLRSPRA